MRTSDGEQPHLVLSHYTPLMC